MTAPRIAIAEDDNELRELILRGLGEEGFEAEGEPSGSGLLALVERKRPDALVIDIGLPDADGRDVCQALRAAGVNAPVIFLTARDALPDRLSGFAVGGDDYLTKPFSFDELVARIRAQLRPKPEPEKATGETRLSVDPSSHAARSGSQSVDLTPTEFRLLSLLVAHPGSVIRRRQLIHAGWPHGARVHENTLDAYLARLRRKLRTLPDAPEIETVHGVGYVVR